MEDIIKTPEKILEEVNAFRKSRILLTAIELKVFTFLDKKLLTSKELAEIINCKTEPLERLLNALVAINYLRKHNGKYFNTKVASEYLVEGKEKFIGMLPHISNLWKRWNELTIKIKPEYKEPGDWTRSFITAMHYRAVKESELLPYLLNLSNVKKVLDIGGGSGVFSIGFVKANPEITATLLDFPEVIKIAKEFIKQSNIYDNFNFIEGNFHNVDFGRGYDLIFLSAVMHINSPEENKKLVLKCADALSVGGQIVIRDYVMDKEKVANINGALFAINMLVATEKGNSYTADEYREWLTNAGFKNIEIKDLGKSNIIVGYK